MESQVSDKVIMEIISFITKIPNMISDKFFYRTIIISK